MTWFFNVFIFHFLQTFGTLKNHSTNVSKDGCVSTFDTSYRAPTTDITHFKPMFHFDTPYTPCKNKNTFEFLMLFLGSGWEVGK